MQQSFKHMLHTDGLLAYADGDGAQRNLARGGGADRALALYLSHDRSIAPHRGETTQT